MNKKVSSYAASSLLRFMCPLNQNRKIINIAVCRLEGKL